MIEKSENITNLAAAVLGAQRDIGHALKQAENPYYKSMYADLTAVIDAVKGPLNANGITFLQAVDMGCEGSAVVDTILMHNSGQYLSTRTPIFCQKENDPQALGKGISYSQRYALQAILGLPTEDDDAEGAMARGKKTEPAKYKKPDNDTKAEKEKEAADLKAKIDKLNQQAWFEFQTVRADDMPEGKIFKEEFFMNELREAFKSLSPAAKKKFVWNQSSVNKMAEQVKSENCLTDIKVAPDA